MATVPLIEVAAAVVGWLDAGELELLPPPPHAASRALIDVHTARCAIFVWAFMCYSLVEVVCRKNRSRKKCGGFFRYDAVGLSRSGTHCAAIAACALVLLVGQPGRIAKKSKCRQRHSGAVQRAASVPRPLPAMQCGIRIDQAETLFGLQGRQ
jgi:hypothetical protein